MPRIAFYTRISTDEDHQKYSLGAQDDRLRAFCQSQYGSEWGLFKIYRDTESGTHMNRPGLEEMLFDAEARAFDVLLVFRVDRLSRKVRELAQMVEELGKSGVTLKSITEPFDTASAAGTMMMQMLGVFAEFEHKTIVERTKVGMEKKAKGGVFVGGHVPFGYQLDPEKGLIVHQEESVIVKRMFKMYAFGMEGVHTICNRLNEAGHRKRSGKKWDRRVILHILRNPIYVGRLRWREVVHEGHHEPIVSPALFDKVNGVLKERVADLNGRRWHNNDERLLTGVIRCARCSSHMFGGGAKKKGKYFPYYVCSKRMSTHDCDQDYVRADYLEAAIIQDVKAMFRDHRFITKIWEEANLRLAAERPDVEKEIANVEAGVAGTCSRLDRYYEAFEKGSMKPGVCGSKVEELNARLRELEAELGKLRTRRQQLELPSLDREMVTALMDDFENVMASGTNPQKKHLLHRVVKKVLVRDRQTVEVWYALPYPSRLEDRHIWLPG